MKQSFSCHLISPGCVEGEILISKDPVLFYQTDFSTGIFTEKGHDLEGKCIAGKILVFPGGKGSSVVQADGMYRLDMTGHAPRGLIVSHLDTVLVSSAIIMEVPMVDDVASMFYEQIQNGDFVRLDATNGQIAVLRTAAGTNSPASNVNSKEK